MINNSIKIVSVVTLITIISSGLTDYPGARIVLTQTGLDYLTEIGLPYLQSALDTTINIPDQSGEKFLIYYELSNIQIWGIHLKGLSAILGSNGLTLKGTDLSIKMRLDYSFTFLVIHESGSIEVDISDGDLSQTILAKRDENGHPILQSDGCAIHVSGVNLEFTGWLDGILNLISGILDDLVEDYLDNNGCSRLSSVIEDDLNPLIQTFQTEANIEEFIEIDYSLVDNPLFTDLELQVDLKGEFVSVKQYSVEPPFSAPPIPELTEFSRMAYLMVSTYTANTAAFAYQEEEFLHINIAPDTLPAKVDIPITTVLFQDLIPAFYNKYPDMNLTLNMYATKPPILKVTPGEARLQGSGIIEFAVYDANCDNAIVHAFSLEVDGSTEVEVGLKQVAGATNVTGKIESLDLEVSILDTEVGTINATKITDLIRLLGNSLIIPLVNSFAGVGWPIPAIDGIELEDTELILRNDYILIGTDVNYVPQQSNP
ncbi:hypothetical protein LOD99_2581 [Oopsacas minuta]|uniref:Uncharacterized protein n=1 Tax=Oopsacas minuta TaxID=111878 RepID=A0AAV7K0L3_9METZ|nr:hypothetical protein LOD99_2581 [Oopsacas minuta]